MLMNYIDFLHYKEQPCRFKLRSGKEVYGVIWEEKHDDEVEYLFASSSIHDTYKTAENSQKKEFTNNIIYKLSLEDVIYAEPLEIEKKPLNSESLFNK